MTRPSQNASLFFTHESAAWPKPAHCRARRPEVCAINPHFCVILPYGNAPRTSLVSERHGIEFRQVWKVASSSLASFFFCNMWGDLRAEKLTPGQPPQPVREPPPGMPARRVVFPTREPIGRFVASSFEVLARLLQRVSPNGQRVPDEMFAEPGGPFSSTVLSSMTRWYGPLQRVLNSSSSAGTDGGAGGAAGGGGGGRSDHRERHMLALVKGFLEDIECAIVYSSAEHLATQVSRAPALAPSHQLALTRQLALALALALAPPSWLPPGLLTAPAVAAQMSFVTSGYAERATLDFQIKLHNVSHDLEQLGGAIGYVRPEGSPPVSRNETAVWKCPLGRENTVEGKGKFPISKADFVAVLAKHPALVQRLCTVYFQDYIWCAHCPCMPPPRPSTHTHARARARARPCSPWPSVALTKTLSSPRATLAAWASRFRPSARAVGN